jgi:hypothetical protein
VSGRKGIALRVSRDVAKRELTRQREAGDALLRGPIGSQDELHARKSAFQEWLDETADALRAIYASRDYGDRFAARVRSFHAVGQQDLWPQVQEFVGDGRAYITRLDGHILELNDADVFINAQEEPALGPSSDGYITHTGTITIVLLAVAGLALGSLLWYFADPFGTMSNAARLLSGVGFGIALVATLFLVTSLVHWPRPLNTLQLSFLVTTLIGGLGLMAMFAGLTGPLPVPSSPTPHAAATTEPAASPTDRPTASPVGIGTPSLGTTEPSPTAHLTPTTFPAPTVTPPVWVGPNGEPTGLDRYAQDALDIQVPPDMTLMVSSTSMDTPVGRCYGGGDLRSLCVMIWAGRSTPRAAVSGLYPGATWVGLTVADVDMAIMDKMLDPARGWFSRSNCEQPNGCRTVHIYVVTEFGTARQLAFNANLDATVCTARQSVVLDPDVTVLRGLQGWLDVEYYFTRGRSPEDYSLLPLGAGVVGYEITQPLYGHIWAYPALCRDDDLQQHAKGWRFGVTKYFVPIGPYAARARGERRRAMRSVSNSATYLR